MKNIKLRGFTLPEVLLAVVILGVVSALTIPMLVDNYRKYSIPIQTHKFFNDMNYAVEMYKKDNHTSKINIKCITNMTNSSHCAYSDSTNADNSRSAGYNQIVEWWSSNIGKYIKNASEPQQYTKKAGYYDCSWVDEESGERMYKTCHSDGGKDHTMSVKLKDGTCFRAWIVANDTIHVIYYTNTKYCGSGMIGGRHAYDGKDGFLFTIDTYQGETKFITSHRTLIHSLNRAQLKDMCEKCNYDISAFSFEGKCHACARLIEVDGWKMAKDYPWNKKLVGRND